MPVHGSAASLLVLTLAGACLAGEAAPAVGLHSERHGGMQLADHNARPTVQPLPAWHLKGDEKDPAFGFAFSQRWSGSLDVAAAGEHIFRLEADDGVRLLIDGRLLVDTWDLKGGQTVETRPVRLEAGRVAICLEYYQRLDAQILDLQWKRPGAAGFEAIPAAAQHPTLPSWPKVATSVRFHPAKGEAAAMVGGRFTGSTKAPTAELTVLVTIATAPAEGQWVELPIADPAMYRYLKYEGPKGSHAAIAELQFLHDGKPISGTVFGTTGSKDGQPSSFANAFDGKVETVSTGNERDDSYAGLDLGTAAVAPTPTCDPAPGTFPRETRITLSTPTDKGFVRYTLDGKAPTWDSGIIYTGPFPIAGTTTIQARAFVPGLAPSLVAMLPITISSKPMEKGLRTFHTGNSLQAAVNAFLIPMAQSAGYDHAKGNAGCAGAPTDWIYNKLKDEQWGPMLEKEAPFDVIITQPFGGHGRPISNEAMYTGKLFEAVRAKNPKARLMIYLQWPTLNRGGIWDKGVIPLGERKADFTARNRAFDRADDEWRDFPIEPGEQAMLAGEVPNTPTPGWLGRCVYRPVKTWDDAMRVHIRYFEILRAELAARYPGQDVPVIPVGLVLLTIKERMAAGTLAGFAKDDDFFNRFFADNIHQNATGEWLTCLVHFACLYKKDPTGLVSTVGSGLTAEQATSLQQLTWEVVSGYRWAFVTPAKR